MNQIIFILDNLETTSVFGINLGKYSNPGDVICLDGDLGAGKTTLTQGIAAGLEVPEDQYVTSPSFAILHEYPGRLPLYHMDFYRLHDYTEIEDLGFDEYFYARGLCVIEWSKRAEEILPQTRLSLFIENVGDETRKVTALFNEQVWNKRLMSILSECSISPST